MAKLTAAKILLALLKKRFIVMKPSQKTNSALKKPNRASIWVHRVWFCWYTAPAICQQFTCQKLRTNKDRSWGTKQKIQFCILRIIGTTIRNRMSHCTRETSGYSRRNSNLHEVGPHGHHFYVMHRCCWSPTTEPIASQTYTNQELRMFSLHWCRLYAEHA